MPPPCYLTVTSNLEKARPETKTRNLYTSGMQLAAGEFSLWWYWLWNLPPMVTASKCHLHLLEHAPDPQASSRTCTNERRFWDGRSAGWGSKSDRCTFWCTRGFNMTGKNFGKFWKERCRWWRISHCFKCRWWSISLDIRTGGIFNIWRRWLRWDMFIINIRLPSVKRD